MLRFLRQWRSMKADSDPKIAVPDTDELRQAGLEIVAQPSQIARWFGELAETAINVNLWLEGQEEWRVSRVVSSNPAQRRLELLVLDCPLVAIGITVNLSFQVRSGVILASCLMADFQAADTPGGVILSLHWPDYCVMHEMRETPRLMPQGQPLAWLELVDFLGCPRSEEIANVAEGGLCLRLPAERVNRLGRTLLISPDKLGWQTRGPETTFSLNVLYVVPDEKGHYLVGGCFSQIAPGWEREWRKRLMKAQAICRVA